MESAEAGRPPRRARVVVGSVLAAPTRSESAVPADNPRSSLRTGTRSVVSGVALSRRHPVAPTAGEPLSLRLSG